MHMFRRLLGQLNKRLLNSQVAAETYYFRAVEARVMFMGLQHDYVQVEGLCALTLGVMKFYVAVCKRGLIG